MREKYVLKNYIAKILSIGIVTVMGFVSRKVYVNSLGDEIMGLNALFTSILSMLSLLELGIGNAIYFNLYKPLAEKDDEQTAAIMRLYANIYRVIGALVLTVGLVLLPFLHFFVDTPLSSNVVYKSYLIMLLDTSLSYYMAYRRNIFNADQKEYFNTNVDALVNVSVCCLQMLAVILTHNYYLFLVIRLAGTAFGNLFIYYKSGKEFPYLKERCSYKLSGEFKSSFFQNVKALCIANIGSFLVSGTDNLLLSRYTDLKAVFIYSNYVLILGVVNQVFHGFFTTMQASIGNYMVLEGREKTYDLFNKFFFLNFIITGYTSVALITLFNDTICLWLGEGYVWNLGIVAVLVFNNYSIYIVHSVTTFRNAAGLFNPYPLFKFLPLIEGLVNLAVSLFLIVPCGLGVLGVFLGTSVSTLFNTIAIPHVVYRYFFEKKCTDFVRRYLLYLVLTVLYCISSVGVCHLLKTEFRILNIVIELLISFAIPMGLSALVFHRTEEFRFVRDLILKYVNGFFGKKGDLFKKG